MANLFISRWLFAALALLAATQLATGAYAASLVHLVALAALTAASLRFLMLIGEVSIAIAAFVGIGAYSAGVATTVMDWPFPVALVIGPVLVSFVAIVIGLITLRVKGPYFMLISFAFAEAARIAFTKTSFIGGTSGMPGIFPPRFMDPWMPTFVVAVVMLALFVLYAVEKSDFGKVLVAIRDNENIARTVGINVLFCKVAAFTISAVCASIVGSLQAFVNNVISPGDFSYLVAVFALAYVKVGGEKSIFGSVAGAVLLSLLASYALGLGAGEHLFYGGAIVLALLLMPDGLHGIAAAQIAKYGKAAKASKAANEGNSSNPTAKVTGPAAVAGEAK